MAVLRFWAAARTAAGVAEEEVRPGPLAEVLAAARDRHGPALGRVLEHASFLVDGQPVGRRDPAGVPVGEAAVVEVLPPFAGG